MDEYEYDEGSDIDNWETEQVFRDHEGEEDDAVQGDITNALDAILAAMDKVQK